MADITESPEEPVPEPEYEHLLFPSEPEEITGLRAYAPVTFGQFHTRVRWVLPATACCFVVLAVLARARALPWDLPITEWVARQRTPGLDEFWRIVTAFGAYRWVAIVVVVCAVAAWRRSRPLAISIVMLAVAVPLVVAGLKHIVARPRPPTALVVQQPGGFSFPSGHPLAVASSWVFIPLVVALYTKRRWIWWATVVVVWTMVVAIAASRVYLGAHWASDVVASLTLAVLFVAGSEVIIELIHTRHAQRQAQRNGDPEMSDVLTRIAARDRVEAGSDDVRSFIDDDHRE